MTPAISRKFLLLPLASAAAWLAVCPAAAGQTPPEEDPQLTDPSWREPAEESAPAADTEPAATAPDYRIRPAPLLPEGSFLPRRRGTMVRSGSGEWVYVFHPDEEGRAEQPMTLLPSATLERMEDVIARRRASAPGADVRAPDGDVRPEFVLTGQALVYGGANYLLPTAFSLASPAPARDEVAGAGDQPGADEPGGLDAAVEELIERIERERPGARALGESSMLADATRAQDDVTGVSGARPRPDGALLVRQRGRLTRQAGAWRFSIDNDGDTGEFQTTMTLLPCLNLQRMELLAADRGENQAFEVSGMVLQYRGRNFLVPTIYRVVRDGDVRPLQ